MVTPEEAQNPAVASPKVLPASKGTTQITTSSVEDEDQQRGKSIVELVKMLSFRAATAITSNPIPYEDPAEEEDTPTAVSDGITSTPIPYEDPPVEAEETLIFWKREI
jgi:hypothetical protein